MNKEILHRVEQIQKVHSQSFFETIYSSVSIHTNIDDWQSKQISDGELLACLEAEIHTIANW